MIIEFIPCSGEKCAREAVIKEFFDNHYFLLSSSDNFIDYDKVEPLDKTLKQQLSLKFQTKVDYLTPKTYQFKLDEYKAEL